MNLVRMRQDFYAVWIYQNNGNPRLDSQFILCTVDPQITHKLSIGKQYEL